MRQKLRRLANERKVSLQRIRRMAQKIVHFTDTNGVDVPPDQHKDFVDIFKSNGASVDESFPEGSFRPVFWDQQLKSAKLKGRNSLAPSAYTVGAEFADEILRSVSCYENGRFHYTPIGADTEGLHALF